MYFSFLVYKKITGYKLPWNQIKKIIFTWNRCFDCSFHIKKQKFNKKYVYEGERHHVLLKSDNKNINFKSLKRKELEGSN